MTYKKTWLSCILWAVYTCVTGIMLADYTMLFWKMYVSSDNRAYMIAFTFVAYALVLGLYCLFRKTSAVIWKNRSINEHTALMWEIFAVLFIFAIGILYRFYLYLQNGADTIVETQFYHMAVVQEGKSVEPLVHGASYLYVHFLSFVFSFLGNKVIAAVWMQIIIEMLTLLLSYFLIRKMLGRITACIVMLIMSVSAAYTSQIFELTPEILFFLLYLIGMYAVGSYVKAYCDNRLGIPMTILGALFSGIVIGILAYLDPISLTLIIILAGVITGVHAKTDRKKVIPFLLFLVSAAVCVLTIAGVLTLDSYVSGDKIERVSMAWLDLYMKHLQTNTIINKHNYSMIECIVQVMLAAFLVMAFWNKRKTQNMTPWICLMLLLAPAPLSSVGILNYQVYYVFIWSVLAGLGLQQSLVFEYDNVTQHNNDAEPRDNTAEYQAVQQGNVPEYKPEQQDKPAESPESPSSKPRFIENPLPLPKKHEKREMGYQYEVAEDKMKYDIEVEDNDDFDL